MKKFENPSIEVEAFSVEDVITASGEDIGCPKFGTDELPDDDF